MSISPPPSLSPPLPPPLPPPPLLLPGPSCAVDTDAADRAPARLHHHRGRQGVWHVGAAAAWGWVAVAGRAPPPPSRITNSWSCALPPFCAAAMYSRPPSLAAGGVVPCHPPRAAAPPPQRAADCQWKGGGGGREVLVPTTDRERLARSCTSGCVQST
ncbi:hypothetical protein I4F81_006239 [Pyropia yezoensis]|uniref:Uncharacterized protein n=1 Tax=Pyropia yezoensis TaxID=2788 RepID=A0ACC3C0F0_PYRYE|nr:hypothetical protein I4F81_006239 [Neopyropia yezoensis]